MTFSTKNILKSLTMQGIAVAGAGTVGAGAALIPVLSAIFPDNQPNEIQEFVDASVVIIGLIMAWVGRWRKGDLKMVG